MLLNDITSPSSILTPPAISSFSFGLEQNSELDSLLDKLEKYSQHATASHNSSSLVCLQNKENVDHVGTPSQNCQSILLLSSWGLPTKVVEQYDRNGISSMFPWQAECLLLPNVLSGGNLVFSAPTSAGKTLVAELLTLKCVLERRKKVLFILPFVSIGQEKTSHFHKLFSCVNVKAGGFIGGQSPAGGLASIDIAVCTIEKANNIVNHLLEKGELGQVGAVVIDELHMIGEPHRGFLLELLITKILYASSSDNSLSEQKNHIQLIGMSATLPNVQTLSRWIGGELYITQYRPVALEEMVFVGNTLYNSSFNELRNFSNATDEESLSFLCQETITEGHSVLVFCPTRSWCESLAKKMATVINCQEDDGTIAVVFEKLKQTMVGVDPVLHFTLSSRVAFHHAGLTVNERVIIEDAFRQGIIKLVIATSTLSSGVNLPARRVIIRTPIFYGKLIDIQVYRQMAGRAGRKGVDTKGESILICKQSEKSKVVDLLKSELHPVHSCIGGGLVGEGSHNPTGMSRAVLEVIVSGTASTLVIKVLLYCVHIMCVYCIQLSIYLLILGLRM